MEAIKMGNRSGRNGKTKPSTSKKDEKVTINIYKFINFAFHLLPLFSLPNSIKSFSLLAAQKTHRRFPPKPTTDSNHLSKKPIREEEDKNIVVVFDYDDDDGERRVFQSVVLFTTKLLLGFVFIVLMGKVTVLFAAATVVAACSVAAVMVGRRMKSRKKWRTVIGILKEFEDVCDTPVSRLRQVVDAMAVEMHAGLASEGGSKLKMLLTFVHHLPNGTEKGTYYALHLGGTYFRILRVYLGGQRSYLDVQDVERHPIPSHLMNSTSEVLFNFLAFSLERFVEKEGNGSKTQGVKRELAFTFSFPVKHSSIASGVLIKWTKGFEISEMVGKDIAECLQGALDRRGLNMHVAALVNDTVGALSLGYYHDPDTVVAVVFGTGSNACYLERTDAIIKCQGLLTASGSMVVNMEWGNFWSSHLPRTSYDIDLDAQSSNSNDMGFEKMIAGMYLGDIVRRVILRMSQESDLFGPTSSVLSEPYVLRTNSVSVMHEDDTPELQEVARILKDLGVSDVPLKVRKLVVKVCDVVTRRAGRLAAAGIAGILKKIGRDGSGGITSGRSRSETQMQKRTVVAVEGGLYMNYTMFREYMEEALNEILGEEVSQYVVVKAMEDGSSIGSALLVASLQS